MSNSQCELCATLTDVSAFTLPGLEGASFLGELQLCEVCSSQISKSQKLNAKHWHCLHEQIWSENPAVKIAAWRVLNDLRTESFALDLLDQLYLDDEMLKFAKAGVSQAEDSTSSGIKVKDSNGTQILEGDSVTLIKDLDVKGAGFTAKRGTLVRNVHLGDDPDLIEGRVNGTVIMLKTCFLKKA
jgi:protein PhnA